MCYYLHYIRSELQMKILHWYINEIQLDCLLQTFSSSNKYDVHLLLETALHKSLPESLNKSVTYVN